MPVPEGISAIELISIPLVTPVFRMVSRSRGCFSSSIWFTVSVSEYLTLT